MMIGTPQRPPKIKETQHDALQVSFKLFATLNKQ